MVGQKLLLYMINFNKFNASSQRADLSLTFNDEKLELYFKKMSVIKPEKGILKRKWQPGLAVQYRTSSSMMSLKCCVNKLQVFMVLDINYGLLYRK